MSAWLPSHQLTDMGARGRSLMWRHVRHQRLYTRGVGLLLTWAAKSRHNLFQLLLVTIACSHLPGITRSPYCGDAPWSIARLNGRATRRCQAQYRRLMVVIELSPHNWYKPKAFDSDRFTMIYKRPYITALIFLGMVVCTVFWSRSHLASPP